MKHSEKSVIVTQVIVRVCYVLLLIGVIGLPLTVYKDSIPFMHDFAELNLLKVFGKNSPVS